MPKNWKNIHPSFTSELQSQWQNRAFTYQQAQEWIQIGLEPADYRLAIYLRDVIECKPREINPQDLKELKNQFQEYLKENEEEFELIEAVALSLDIKNSKAELTDQELEKYLSEKRLDLQKYFVFNLGQEIKANSEITVSDKSGEIVSEPLPNIRLTEPLLSQHLTQLFNDGYKKTAIAFAGKHTNQPTPEWSGEQLNRKINNGQEVYIVFDKSEIKNNPHYINQKATSNTQLGELSWPQIVILAVEASPHAKIFQSKKNVLEFLRKGDSAIFLEESSENEMNLLEQMGVDSSEYEATELKRMLEYAEIAKQNKDKLPSGEGEIKKIILFSPPHFQDKDCAVVISDREMTEEDMKIISTLSKSDFHLHLEVMKSYLPKIWLLVYETPWKNIGDNLYVKQIDKLFLKSEEAEKEADELVEKLMNKNNPYPACSVFEKVGDVFAALSNICDIEGVEGFRFSSFSFIKNNPDGCFKPFDIVRIETWRRDGKTIGIKFNYSHVGIYLGKDKNNKHFVAHVTSDPDKAWIAEWRELFDENSHTIHRHHIFVTYKADWIIKSQIARAVASNEYDNSYNLLLRNCQQFANKLLLGLNISNEATFYKSGKSLKDEILETNWHFNHLTISNANQEYHKQEREKIDQYTTQIEYKPFWEWNKLAKLKPNSNCKLQ